jgi:hypothetical protein
LQDYKGYAAIAFARANKVNRITMDSPNARYGIMASGKSYADIRQALREFGITPEIAAKIGLRLYKIGMPWPLEPQGVREFAVGLEEIFIVEERRELVENQVKQELFNWRDESSAAKRGVHQCGGEATIGWVPCPALIVGVIHASLGRAKRILQLPSQERRLSLGAKRCEGADHRRTRFGLGKWLSLVTGRSAWRLIRAWRALRYRDCAARASRGRVQK